ncbi:zf-CCHC domain-containing protein [Tanacetum coccineum]
MPSLFKSLTWPLQSNSQVKDNKIDLLVQQYEQFTILEEESTDSGFARFNTIITSLKVLDEGFSSKNYVRKFLRALHPKWREKVMAIEESKDLSSLALDELIGNLKVHKVVMEKDSKIYKGKKERVKQPREEKKSFRQRDEKKGKSDRKCFRCGDPNHLIGDCPKPPRNKDQKAFIGGSWSNSENEADDKTNDETCLMDQSSNEVCLRTCLEPDEWIKDSGCSKHMTGNKSLFSTYKAYDGGKRGYAVLGSENTCFLVKSSAGTPYLFYGYGILGEVFTEKPSGKYPSRGDFTLLITRPPHSRSPVNTSYSLGEQLRCLDCRNQYAVLSGKVDASYLTGGYGVSVDLSEQDTLENN